MDKLMAQLTPEQRDLFNVFSEADSQFEEIHNRRKFGYGFHLGALLMLEVMKGKEKNVRLKAAIGSNGPLA